MAQSGPPLIAKPSSAQCGQLPTLCTPALHLSKPVYESQKKLELRIEIGTGRYVARRTVALMNDILGF